MRVSGKRVFWCGPALAALLLLAGAWLLRPASVTSLAEVKQRYTPSEAYLLDRNGVVLDSQRIDLGVRRLAWTPLAEISPALVSAVVEGEDRRFWQHRGVDWMSVTGAARDALLQRSSRGASTISMQLASLLASSRPTVRGTRSWTQKLRQVRLARGLESQWSKREILEAYLNLLQFRGELQGIRATAQRLAHKTPSGLDAAESRVLAALLPSPGAAPSRVAARACARLATSTETVSCAQLEAAARQLLGSNDAMVSDVRLAPHLAGALLKQPGQNVRTTLDVSVQRLARDALGRQLAGLRARNVRDGAALVVDNASGDVLAYVGSGGPNSRAPEVDGVRGERQAGSTLKPFLYELALERRYLTGASLLEDSPVNIDTPSGIYLPQDYEHNYLGAVSVRTALGGSLNIPAVRTLMLVGVEAFRDRLRALGFEGITQDGAFYGYSLALGSAEVTLWEQAQAYRTLARGGAASALRLRAEDPLPASYALLPADASFVVGDVLSDRAARAVTFGLDNSLATGYWSAVKTGTSKDMRDNWCIGFTSRYTVAVWVGNFEGDPMHDVSGVTGAAPVWREIMDGLQTGGGSAAPSAPAGTHAVAVRFAGGSEPPRREWFLSGTGTRGAIMKVAPEAREARISSPGNGVIVAIDPDIPLDRQRVPIRVQGGEAGFALTLDDALIGHTGQSLLWQPLRGAHRLALVDASGAVVDRILFTVR
jgi:penicillin-binding protein 1C